MNKPMFKSGGVKFVYMNIQYKNVASDAMADSIKIDVNSSKSVMVYYHHSHSKI